MSSHSIGDLSPRDAQTLRLARDWYSGLDGSPIDREAAFVAHLLSTSNATPAPERPRERSTTGAAQALRRLVDYIDGHGTDEVYEALKEEVEVAKKALGEVGEALAQPVLFVDPGELRDHLSKPMAGGMRMASLRPFATMTFGLYTAPPDDVMNAAKAYRRLRDGSGWPAVFAGHDEPEPLRGAALDLAMAKVVNSEVSHAVGS